MPLAIADETTVLTNKLVALTDRKTAVVRDLYDSWYFLKAGFPVSDALVMERTGKGLAVYLKGAIGFIKKTYTARNVLHGLGATCWMRNKRRGPKIILFLRRSRK